MARSVDQILISNWTDVGTKTLVERYSVDIGVTWTDDAGVVHTWNGTRQFPNALASVPLHVLKRMMEQIILQAVRVELGIDTWEAAP